eukprot:scaffold519_cov331-Pavlova_lutheri.AAC.21
MEMEVCVCQGWLVCTKIARPFVHQENGRSFICSNGLGAGFLKRYSMQFELWKGGAIHNHAILRLLPLHHLGCSLLVCEHVAQHLCISEFGRQPCPDDVVRGGHDFHDVSLEVGVGFVGAQCHRFSWFQTQQVQHEHAEDAHISWVLLGQLQRPFFFGAERPGLPFSSESIYEQLCCFLGPLWFTVHEVSEGISQRLLFSGSERLRRMGAPDHLFELRHVSGGLGHALGVSEPAERLEVAQCDGHLRLRFVVGIGFRTSLSQLHGQ